MPGIPRATLMATARPASSDKRKPRLHACDVPKAMEKFMEELGQSPGVFSGWSTVCFIVSKRLVNSNSIFL